MILLSYLSISKHDGIVVFPNPTTGSLTIDIGQYTNSTLRLFSADGRLIMSNDKPNTGEVEFQIHETSGIYFLTIDSEVIHQTIKVIKL